MRSHYQSKADSFMEAITNTAIGFIVSLITWHFVAAWMQIPMTMEKNLIITGVFTIVSIARGYILRRMFDGRTVWGAAKNWYYTRNF